MSIKNTSIVKINFKGGLISPGKLLDILEHAKKAGVRDVRFGLRQQLLIEVDNANEARVSQFLEGLNASKFFYEVDADESPNIISSYPAEEVFISRNWLSEGIYKDIFDAFEHAPRLKINIADSMQSFTPLFTGNINWIASDEPNFWFVSIRFPKTNHIYTWSQWVYTSEIAPMSKKIEQLMYDNPSLFFDNQSADGALLFEMLMNEHVFNTMPAANKLDLPRFMLPYYEGFNRYNNQLWLGIYRRDERFSIDFLQELCQLCLATKVGLLCSTSWKSIIIKSIDESDRQRWDALLARHQINVRHAANELNFQVEDRCDEGLKIKNDLVNWLAKQDARTFGVCIGIKTRAKSEVFSSILIKQRRLNVFGLRWLRVFDVLIAKDFNPNQRTGEVFKKGCLRHELPVVLQNAILQYYEQIALNPSSQTLQSDEHLKESSVSTRFLAQCPNCMTVYDERVGQPEFGVEPNTSFMALRDDYECPCCETPKHLFKQVDEKLLYAC